MKLLTLEEFVDWFNADDEEEWGQDTVEPKSTLKFGLTGGFYERNEKEEMNFFRESARRVVKATK
jgi:hypothetical protein